MTQTVRPSTGDFQPNVRLSLMCTDPDMKLPNSQENRKYRTNDDMRSMLIDDLL